MDRVGGNGMTHVALLVRSAASADSAAILALMIRVVHSTVNEPSRDATIENVTSNLRRWEREPETCLHLVAEVDGAVVGVVLVKDFWNLCSLFVAQERQGTGIGRRLMLGAIEVCKARSPKNAIYLNAWPSAVPFYAKLGFEAHASSQKLPPGVQAMRLMFAAGAA